MNVNKLKGNNKEPSALMAGGSPNKVNPWKKEYWRAFSNETLVYNKEKTFENCWKKYNMYSRISNTEGDPDFSWDSNRRNHYILNSGGNMTPIKHLPEWWNTWNAWVKDEPVNIPYIEDIENYINTDDNFLSLNGHMSAEYKVYETIRNWYENNDIIHSANNNLFGNYISNQWWGSNKLFKEKDSHWKFNINLEFDAVTCNMIGLMACTNVKEVTFNFKRGSLVAMDTMFSSTDISKINVLFNGSTDIPINDIKEGISIDGHQYYYKGFQPVSVQRLFQYCKSFSNPRDVALHLFSWRHCKQFVCFLSSCENITEVPPACGCTEFEEHPANTMTINSGNWVTHKQAWYEHEFNGEAKFGHAQEMFYNTPNLTKVSTIIDCIYLVPGWSTNYMFTQTGITQIRLKNLANGVWRFDGNTREDPNLPNLDKPSIDYLFNNLRNMTEFQEGMQASNFLLRNNSELWCPEEWRVHITSDMINAAKQKGWSIYINRQIQ